MTTTEDPSSQAAQMRRFAQIRQSNANQAIEGFHPDRADIEIQARYVSGEVSTDDLIQHAKDFVNRARGMIPKP